MKNIFRYIIAALCAVSILACDRDDDTLVAYLESDTTISTLEDNIVLTVGNADGLALTIYWDELGTAYLNNPNAQMPSSVVVNAVQFSLSDSFDTVNEVSVDSDELFVQFTVSELNTIVIGLGAEGGVATPVYVRLSTALGDNTEPVYSNVLSLTVTGYTIDMSYITLRGVSGGEYTGTDITISATDTEGEYAGFAYISGDWWNFFFVEGDGTIWGSVEDSGPFDLETKSDISSWNIWFPTYGGLYYIEMNSNNAEWSCQLISGVSLTAGSAEAVSMTYSKTYNAYYLVFTTSADSEAIEVAYDATLYNYTTGEGSTTTVNYPLVAASDGTFSVGAVGTSTGITAGTAGTYTLALYMGDTTWKLSEGSVELGGGDEEEESGWGEDASYVAATTDYLYIYDSSKATVGSLAATSTGVYEGFFYMTSWYNFWFGDNEDASAATVLYGSYPSGDDGALYRLYCSSDQWNFWWDFSSAACVYLTVDTNERSWSYMEITDIDIVGIGDNWSADAYPMTLGTDGLWTADVTLPDSNLWGPWGIQFLLNENWSYVYAPSTGNTLVAGSAATPEGSYTEGATYTVTIDLYNMTYTIEEASDSSDEGDSGDDEEDDTWGTDASYVVATSDSLYIYDNNSYSTVGVLASTSDGVYEGFFYMSSWYNFVFADTREYSYGTTNVYGSYPSSDDGALYRLYCSDDKYNIWWNSDSAACVYLTVDTNERSWSYTEVTSVALSGDFNSWATTDLMTLGTDGLWTIDVTPGSWGTYGIQFLINTSWSWCYSPYNSTSTLVSSSSSTWPYVDAESGVTYTVSLDLYNMEYTIK